MLAVLSGGGTAGHINPALALADELVSRGWDVRFAGTPGGVESRLVPAAGIPESFKFLVKEIRSLALDIEPISYQKRAERAEQERAAQAEDAVDVFAGMSDADDLVRTLSDAEGEPALVGDATSDKE